MNGVYWGLVALCIMGRQDALDRDEMIRYVMSCWDENMGQSHRLSSVHWSYNFADMILC
jgi:prenyltransferase beta subunit